MVMGDAELVPARFGQKRFETQLFRPLVRQRQTVALLGRDPARSKRGKLVTRNYATSNPPLTQVDLMDSSGTPVDSSGFLQRE